MRRWAIALALGLAATGCGEDSKPCATWAEFYAANRLLPLARLARDEGAIPAQAIASLQGTEVELGGDIDNLIKEMQASIDEADQFISGLKEKS